jgi:hypothetical protein
MDFVEVNRFGDTVFRGSVGVVRDGESLVVDGLVVFPEQAINPSPPSNNLPKCRTLDISNYSNQLDVMAGYTLWGVVEVC